LLAARLSGARLALRPPRTFPARRPQGIEARSVGKSVIFNGAPDCRCTAASSSAVSSIVEAFRARRWRHHGGGLGPSAACKPARAPSASRSSPEGAGRRAGGKDGSWLWAQSPLHALRRRCGNSHRNLRRRANDLQPDPRPRLPLKANLLRFRAYCSDARLPPVPPRVHERAARTRRGIRSRDALRRLGASLPHAII
jgi:hypothetical protein